MNGEVRWYRTPKETAEDDDDDDDDWELKGWEPYGMVGEGGQRRRVKGRARLPEEDEVVRERSLGGPAGVKCYRLPA